MYILSYTFQQQFNVTNRNFNLHSRVEFTWRFVFLGMTKVIVIKLIMFEDERMLWTRMWQWTAEACASPKILLLVSDLTNLALGYTMPKIKFRITTRNLNYNNKFRGREFCRRKNTGVQQVCAKKKFEKCSIVENEKHLLTEINLRPDVAFRMKNIALSRVTLPEIDHAVYFLHYTSFSCRAHKNTHTRKTGWKSSAWMQSAEI